MVTGSFNQSLAHGLKILLLFDTGTPAFTVAEISRRLGYSESKAYRLVRALIKHRFLREIPKTGRYSLGVSALGLGLLAQQTFNLSAIALPLMKELCALTKLVDDFLLRLCLTAHQQPCWKPLVRQAFGQIPRGCAICSEQNDLLGFVLLKILARNLH